MCAGTVRLLSWFVARCAWTSARHGEAKMLIVVVELEELQVVAVSSRAPASPWPHLHRPHGQSTRSQRKNVKLLPDWGS